LATPPPLNDIRLHDRSLAGEVRAAIDAVIDDGQFILGARGAAFEHRFADFVGVRHGIGVASGTDALRLGLLALGVRAGDAVVTVANAGVPPVAAIEAAGAHPVFVDVDSVTQMLDPSELERAISPAVKAVVVVHLYGHPADMAPILDIARRHGVKVLEDCAHAHGARHHGRTVGSLGDAAAFSFYPTKNLGAVGDAGMVVSNDDAVAERARLLRNYGWQQDRCSEVAGYNSRLDELQAAVLLVKLQRLRAWNARRVELAARYAAWLSDVVEVPGTQPWAEHVYHLYVIRTARRDELRDSLTARGIGCGIHYAPPVHRLPAYRRLQPSSGPLPVTERLAETVLSLPMYPELKEEQVDLVGRAVCDFFRG